MSHSHRLSCRELLPITDLGAPDQVALRTLNNAHAQETSHLEPADWQALLGAAEIAVAAPQAGGLLIGIAPGAAYASENYRWFCKRYEVFLYIDRVIVAPAQRGRGLARAFYGFAAEHARRCGLGRLVCEVNRVPPNPGSDAFHAALGFHELATVTRSPEKTVRYLELSL